MADDADDLAALVAIANAPAGRGGRRRAPRRNGEAVQNPPEAAAPQAELAEGEADEDLAVVAGIAAARPIQRHEQRSWQLLQFARAKRESHIQQRKLDRISRERDAANKTLEMVATQFPAVGAAFGIKKKSTVMSISRAQVALKIAFMPCLRGEDHASRKVQNNSCFLVAKACLELQVECERKLFLDVPCSTDSYRPIDLSVHHYAWQWDESSQRMRAALACQLRDERTSYAAVAVQVIVQHGQMSKFLFFSDGRSSIDCEPIFCKSRLLQVPNSDSIREAVLRAYPFDLTDAEDLSARASKCDVLLLTWCCDRATANFSFLKWIWSLLNSHSMPDNLVLHVEPCVAHGVALVKSRPQRAKEIVRSSHSLAALFRGWRFATTMRTTIISQVRSKLKTKRAVRPASSIAKSHRLIDFLFGGDDCAWLWKKKNGTRTPGNLLVDVRALADVVDLGVSCELVHWCFVTEGSAEHAAGLEIGAPCCKDFEERVEKIAVRIINVIIHKRWEKSADGRWTYTLPALRKFALGFLTRVFPDCLSDIYVFWQLSEGLAATLARQIALDSGDFEARSKMRLLRVCKTLCDAEVSWQIGVEIIVLSEIDTLLYDVLGNQEKERATLETLLNEPSALLAKTQRRMLELLQRWNPDTEFGFFLRAMGGNLNSMEVRMYYREVVLSTSCALFDHFEVMMSGPLYSVVRMGDRTLSRPECRELAVGFFGQPERCLPLSCQQIRKLFPTEQALMRAAPHLAQALSSGAFHAIDFAERTHAQVRQDLKSSGRARNFSSSCSRVFCQQVAAAQEKRFGAHPGDVSLDTLAAPPPRPCSEGDCALVAAEVGAAPKKAKKTGLSPKVEFQNSKLAAYKKLHAPHRALTEPELDAFYERSRSQWAALSEAEQSSWDAIWRGGVRRRSVRSVQPVATGQSPALDQKPLWLAAASKESPVHPEKLLEIHRSTSKAERRRGVSDDPDLLIRADESLARPGANSNILDLHSPLFGCAANKKNICRDALEDDLSRRLDQHCALFNAFVDSLSREVATSSRCMIWLRGRGVAPCDVVVLLCGARFSPKCQYFLRCCLADAPADAEFRMPELPCVVRLAVGAARVNRNYPSLQFNTSDELGLELARKGSGVSWDLVPLKWHLVEFTDNLVDMVITSAGEAFEKKPVVKKAKRFSHCEALNLPEDPFAVGRAAAQVIREQVFCKQCRILICSVSDVG